MYRIVVILQEIKVNLYCIFCKNDIIQENVAYGILQDTPIGELSGFVCKECDDKRDRVIENINLLDIIRDEYVS